jgi:hypothetical protein
MNTFEVGMPDVEDDSWTLQHAELDAVSGGIGENAGPVVAYRSLLETMSESSCNI